MNRHYLKRVGSTFATMSCWPVTLVLAVIVLAATAAAPATGQTTETLPQLRQRTIWAAPWKLDLPWRPALYRIRIQPSYRGQDIAFPGRGLTVELPRLEETSPYVSWALSAARQSRWDALAAEMGRFGLDGESVSQEVPQGPTRVPSLDLWFGGEFDPAWPADVLAKRLERFVSLGFDSPVVPIRDLKGEWRERHDAFFRALDGKASPVLGLCIREMDFAELLAIPEFVQRYAGRFHSIIANYDLTNGHVDGPSDSAIFRRSVDRVVLAATLVRRAAPSAYVWLNVGYHRRPSWQDWIRAFDTSRFSGLLLSGDSAVMACVHPEVAKEIRKKLSALARGLPIGLLGFRLYTVDQMLFAGDDMGLRRYGAIRDELQKAGIQPLHFTYSLGH